MFSDRRAAGRLLAERLRPFASVHPIVLGIPRGGVPVAAEVAEALGAPLDVIIAHKIGCPWQPELAVGAVGEEGVTIIDESLVFRLGIAPAELVVIERREREELTRSLERYRGTRSSIPVRGRDVIVVDDGIATGATMKAAIEVLRARGAARVIVATPVAPAAAIEELGALADDVIVVETPERFSAVGRFYDSFEPTSSSEVAALLRAPTLD